MVSKNLNNGIFHFLNNDITLKTTKKSYQITIKRIPYENKIISAILMIYLIKKQLEIKDITYILKF